MTPDIQQGRDGYPRSQFPQWDSGAAVHPATHPAQAPRRGQRDTAARPAPVFTPAQAHQEPHRQAPPSPTGERREREDRSIVGIIPYLAVLLCTVLGVYIAWREGAAGGGDGGVVIGAALLAAAVARLLLPARLAGLLATRKRATDVLTLTAFGICLLAAGLVLPR